ncbi:DUF5133 domain-containing protein [Streptomyces sp. NPDC048566]|uniref:DUF5133 domain-containing protein n=1 Tax=Streptomyces sp. NPDC048566 TaxID=3365569 RepID=UPI00371A36BC
MLMPLPATLRRLVEEYETLLAEETLAGASAPGARLRDLAYTLCVSTGTREVADALDTARAYLARTAGASSPVRRVVVAGGAGPAARRGTNARATEPTPS